MSPQQALLERETVRQQLTEGHRLSQARRYAEAEVCARRVIALEAGHAMAHNNLGFARQMQGDLKDAVALFERALALDPGLHMARRNLALAHARLGDWRGCLVRMAPEVSTESGRLWMQARLSEALTHRDLNYAGAIAAASAALHRGSARLASPEEVGGLRLPLREPLRRVTDGALRHDIAQFDYLVEQGVFEPAFREVTDRYRAILARREAAGETQGERIAGEDLEAIGDTYNRLLHWRPTPRVERALSLSWRPERVEDDYLAQAQGVVVIDDFLTAEALRELRAYCLQSTVWLANRYAHGRLGALFHQGFNCQLLLQIAEELRNAFPRMIGDRHTLRQMWGFKQAPFQPGASTTHADFAAVNVNFWITPDEANLAPDVGGMSIYDVDAPRHWDFHTYNGRGDVIRQFLNRQGARTVVVPYRQNRAVIFNSDLFHCTEEVRFRPEYENRRINVTMLYGVRADDERKLAKPDPLTDPGYQAWRSAALSRSRRR